MNGNRYTTFHPRFDFSRPTEWRWERAGWLVETARRLDRRVDDDWVAAARAAIRGQGREAMRRTVRAARDHWTGDPAVRHELEAWLLTDLPLAEVAGRMGASVEVVTAYEALFFAVREVRAATDWLTLRAVGYSAVRGFTGPLPYAAWKLVALHGGPVMLEVVIAATTGRSLPTGSVRRTGKNRAAAEARLRLKVELWIALTAATTPAELARATQALCQMREQQADETDQPATVASGLLAAEEFLLALPALTRWPTVQSPTRPRHPTTGGRSDEGQEENDG